MSENINEKWISIEEAAEHLGIKPVTVRDWIKKGKGIPAHKIGKKLFGDASAVWRKKDLNVLPLP